MKNKVIKITPIKQHQVDRAKQVMIARSFSTLCATTSLRQLFDMELHSEIFSRLFTE